MTYYVRVIITYFAGQGYSNIHMYSKWVMTYLVYTEYNDKLDMSDV